MNEWVLPSRIGGDKFKVIDARRANRSKVQELLGSGTINVRVQFGNLANRFAVWTVVFAGITVGLALGILLVSLIKLF